MSVDLDELFDAMRRQADAVPLAGVEQARQRGRHRDRVRVVATIAVVVTLVAVGTSLTLRPGPAVPELPVVGSPLPLDGVPSGVRVVTDGTRAYAVWTRQRDDTVWAAATDLSNGAVVWKPQRLSESEDLVNVLVTPSAVVVVTKPRVDPPNGFMFYLLDPRTGASNGGLAGDNAESNDAGEEDWVFAGDEMVTMEPPSGQVAFNGVAGSESSYARLLGWGTTADDRRLNQSGPSAAFTDSRVVLVTVDGTADVYDSRTGKKLRSVRLGLVSGKQMAVFDGTLSMADPHDSPTGPQRLRFVDVSGGAAGAWETAPMPGPVIAMSECGTGRVCVATPGRVTAFDVRQKRVAWQAATGVTGSAQLSSSNGRTLVSGTGGFDFFDPDGRRLLTGSSAFHGGWLDPEELLVTDGDGVLARASASFSKTLGRAPSRTLACTSTSTRLACVTATAVTTWDLS
jgi:hypothetical protein